MFLIIEFNIMENIPIEKFIVKVYSTPSCLWCGVADCQKLGIVEA